MHQITIQTKHGKKVLTERCDVDSRDGERILYSTPNDVPAKTDAANYIKRPIGARLKDGLAFADA